MSDRLKVLALFDVSEAVPRGYRFGAEFREESWKVEAQIVRALRVLGHDVRMLAVHDDLHQLIDEVRDFQPDVVFNLMEEFAGDSNKVPNVVGVLEMLGVPYTGAPPLALLLCKDKSLAKDILTHHNVPNPAYQLIEVGKAARLTAKLTFPLVIKPRIEDASYGISMSSVVYSVKEFEERVRFVHERKQDALVEQYVAGRELYASLLGGREMRVFPLREVKFGKLGKESTAPIATYKVKWDKNYRDKKGVLYSNVRDIDPKVEKRIAGVVQAACKALQVSGYARIDLRLTDQGEPYVLEVNPNPDLGRYEDFASSAKKGGLSFEQLMQVIIKQALPARSRMKAALA
jgi:D-alanine-D-alanine ligase